MKPDRRVPTASVLAALLLAAGAGLSPARAQEDLPTSCGQIGGGYGPFDYRTAPAHEKALVETPHFPKIVENLVRGNRGYLGGDLEYTLRAFPNHHRALISVIRYGRKTGTDKPPNMTFTVECFLKRAVFYRPNDGLVRVIYAGYLFEKNRADEAQVHLSKAEEFAPNDPFRLHSIGSVYLEAKVYDKARIFAQRTEALGYTNSPLKNALLKAGQWTEAGATDTAASAPPAASAPGAGKAP
jgi:tetratricopeptide (TPR) repeat protein